MNLPVPLGVIVLGAGGALVYLGLTGQSPLDELRTALTAGRLDGITNAMPLRRFAGSIYGIDPEDIGPNFGRGGGAREATSSAGRPAELVAIGQGSHRLTPTAAAAFKAAERGFGRAIPVTDSVRDYDQQSTAYRSDPNRFGNPDGNAHVAGIAVDVNLRAIGANPAGSTPRDWLRDPVYLRLHQAMTRAGFCNWQQNRGSLGGKIPEPWHYSHGRCG